MAQDIDKWLEDLGLGRYAQTFAENEIDLGALRHITEEDFKEMGVALGPRRTMIAAIQELTLETVSPKLATNEPSGERRQVTVLFADLSSFTQLSRELGAEATHHLLNRYFETVDRIVEAYGGTIDKHIGDNVMAVFGAPIAHSNDPERAVRAALDIHEAMADLSRELGQTLHAHIGIASGQVVASGTGSDSHREYTVTGDTVNLASRLDDLAGPGETYVSRAVQSAVAGIAVFSPRGEATVKGLPAPVPVWSLQGLDTEGGSFDSSPFVAREMEQVQFRAVLQGSLARGRGQGILVQGDPGIGKTRLLEQFCRIATEEGFAVHRSLVLDFGTGKGQDSIGALCRSLLDIEPGSGKAIRSEAAEAAIATAALPEARRVFLNEILDLPQSAENQSLYQAMEQEARELGKRETVAALAMARAHANPLTIIIEDIHWADEATLSHLRALVATAGEVPIVMVMSSRLEGPSLERDWLASLRGTTVTTMELQPLGDAETKLLAESMGQEASEQIERCVARSEGNPLFLIQLIRNLAEDEGGDLPDSLHGLILARMDRLSGIDKTALQAASVIGQKFSLEALSQVSGLEGYDCSNLLSHRLIRPEGTDYLFDHALIRDGVYTSLLQDRRKTLHQRAAAWYRDRDLLLVAEHLDRASSPEAPRAYLAAARQENGHHRIAKARDLVVQGLDLCLEESSDGYDLNLLHGEILHNLERFEDSTQAYATAARQARSEEENCTALLGQAFGYIRMDQHQKSEYYLDQVEKIARANSLTGILAQVHRRRATITFVRGDNTETLVQSREALRLARQAGDRFVEAEALSCMADAEWAGGRLRTALEYFQSCLALCLEEDYRRFALMIEKMIGDATFYIGDFGQAQKIYESVIAKCLALGERRTLIAARLVNDVYINCLGGRNDVAQEHAEAVHRLIMAMGVTRKMMDGRCYLAMVDRAKGNRAQAVRLLSEAVALAEELDVVWSLPFVYGELALASEDLEERSKYLSAGEDLLKAGVGGFYSFEFYRPALESCIESQDWDRLDRLATQFAACYAEEPLGLPDFLVDRARAIAAAARGRKDPALLQSLIERASDMGVKVDIPALQQALTD